MKFNDKGRKITDKGVDIPPMADRAYNKALTCEAIIIRWAFYRAMDAAYSIRR